jgi:hypothetical protein
MFFSKRLFNLHTNRYLATPPCNTDPDEDWFSLKVEANVTIRAFQKYFEAGRVHA